jgi:hypothetical protein
MRTAWYEPKLYKYVIRLNFSFEINLACRGVAREGEGKLCCPAVRQRPRGGKMNILNKIYFPHPKNFKLLN